MLSRLSLVVSGDFIEALLTFRGFLFALIGHDLLDARMLSGCRFPKRLKYSCSM
jgi:hypothetical protein